MHSHKGSIIDILSLLDSDESGAEGDFENDGVCGGCGD